MEIRRVLETFDSSGIDTATLATLVAAGYADLAVSTPPQPPRCQQHGHLADHLRLPVGLATKVPSSRFSQPELPTRCVEPHCRCSLPLFPATVAASHRSRLESSAPRS